MTPRRFHLSTRGWFQLTMIPALILVSASLGWNVYHSIERVILRAFEQKLGAVSTTVAAFISPEDHEWLMQRPVITGLAFAPDGTLFAIDSSRSVLMRIRSANGVAEDEVVSVPADLRDLVFSGAEKNLAALALPSGQVYTLDPATGHATPRLALGPQAQALTLGPEGEVFAITDRLVRLNLRTGTATPVSDAPMPRLFGACYDGQRHVIWAIGPRRQLLEIDPASGKVQSGVQLAEGTPALGDLAYDEQRRLMLGSHKSILRVNPATGEVAPAHFLPAFGKELSPQYRAYSQPMLRLINELNLTYLYTQVVTDQNRIIYGIDGTLGESHSPLHSEETLPAAEAAGIQELMRSGSLYHSPVARWDSWGLLKGSLAPVFDSTGKVVAMTGADVDVSLITHHTRRALLALVAVGVGALLLATLVATLVARRVRRPLLRIKSTALEVAAGDYARRISVASPSEARDLAEAFNRMAAALESNLQALHSSIQELLRNRNRYELARRLGQRYGLDCVLGPIEGLSVNWQASGRAVTSASGAVRHGDRLVIWLSDSSADGLAAARARANLALRVTARLQQDVAATRSLPVPGHTVAPFAQTAARVPLPAGVRALAVVSLADRTVRLLGDPVGQNPADTGTVRLADPEVTVVFQDYRLLAENA